MGRPRDLEAEIYEQRILVFLETQPQSNEYRQVIFTPDQFARMSKSIGDVVDTHDGLEKVAIDLSATTYDLPDLPSTRYV